MKAARACSGGSVKWQSGLMCSVTWRQRDGERAVAAA